MAAPRLLACALACALTAAGCGVPASTLKTSRPAVVARANQICTRSTARAQAFVEGMGRPSTVPALNAVLNEDGAITQDAVNALEYLQPRDSRRRSFELFLEAETAVQDEGIKLGAAINRRSASAFARSERRVVRQSRRAAAEARAYGLRPCPWVPASALLIRRPARGGAPDALLAVWERAARELPAPAG
jgi:hypothetical protein